MGLFVPLPIHLDLICCDVTALRGFPFNCGGWVGAWGTESPCQPSSTAVPGFNYRIALNRCCPSLATSNHAATHTAVKCHHNNNYYCYFHHCNSHHHSCYHSLTPLPPEPTTNTRKPCATVKCYHSNNCYTYHCNSHHHSFYHYDPPLPPHCSIAPGSLTQTSPFSVLAALWWVCGRLGH